MAKLRQLAQTDKEFDNFGANSHHYKLEPLRTLEEINRRHGRHPRAACNNLRPLLVAYTHRMEKGFSQIDPAAHLGYGKLSL
jgi:hypothetical protein